MSFLQDVIHRLQSGTSQRNEFLQTLDDMTRKLDEFATKMVKEHPGFEMQEVTEEENPDEMSSASTCATPVMTNEMLAANTYALSSERNFALEFFKVELDTFETFLSVHERVVVEKTRQAAAPEALEGAQIQLQNYQVCFY